MTTLRRRLQGVAALLALVALMVSQPPLAPVSVHTVQAT